jgi:hypothetical protein
MSNCSGSCCACRRKGFGGVGPPSVTDERKPSRCRPRAMFACILETGMDVNPSRAFEAFCKCEQTCARLTRDIMAGVGGNLPSMGCGDEWARWRGRLFQQAVVQITSVSTTMLHTAPRFNCAWCRRRMLCSKFLDWLGGPQVTSGSLLPRCHSVELGPAATKLPTKQLGASRTTQIEDRAAGGRSYDCL